jgi:hypothetical protein
MLSSSDSMRVNRKLLELLNAILQRGGVAVCETACLLGVIPAVLRFTEPHIPQGSRYEAARFIHTMCTRSVLTLQVRALPSHHLSFLHTAYPSFTLHTALLHTVDAFTPRAQRLRCCCAGLSRARDTSYPPALYIPSSKVVHILSSLHTSGLFT